MNAPHDDSNLSMFCLEVARAVVHAATAADSSEAEAKAARLGLVQSAESLYERLGEWLGNEEDPGEGGDPVAGVFD